MHPALPAVHNSTTVQTLQEMYAEEGGDGEKGNILKALPRNLWQKSTFDPFRIKTLPAPSPKIWLLSISLVPLSKTDKLSTYNVAVSKGASCGHTPKGNFTLLICSVVQARLPPRDAAVHVRQVIQAACLACTDRNMRNNTFPAVGSEDKDMFANFVLSFTLGVGCCFPRQHMLAVGWDGFSCSSCLEMLTVPCCWSSIPFLSCTQPAQPAVPV